MNFCTHCGEKLEKGVTFCTKCGQQVKDTQEKEVHATLVENDAEQSASSEKKKGNSTLYADSKYATFKQKPELLKIIGAIGSILMILALWMPFITIEVFGRKASASLNYLFVEETDASGATYFVIFVVIVATVLFAFRRHILASIAVFISACPVLLMLCACLFGMDYEFSFSIGCFVYFLGYIVFSVALNLQWKTKRMVKKGLI